MRPCNLRGNVEQCQQRCQSPNSSNYVLNTLATPSQRCTPPATSHGKNLRFKARKHHAIVFLCERQSWGKGRAPGLPTSPPEIFPLKLRPAKPKLLPPLPSLPSLPSSPSAAEGYSASSAQLPSALSCDFSVVTRVTKSTAAWILGTGHKICAGSLSHSCPLIRMEPLEIPCKAIGCFQGVSAETSLWLALYRSSFWEESVGT